MMLVKIASMPRPKYAAPSILNESLKYRMLVLGPETWPSLAWGRAWPTPAKALLAPYPSEGMVAWPVSPRVGNVKNNGPSLIEPIAGVS
jgi:putative SOS response-associated peptidase YedK